ncbi:MAG: pyruvate:ferredoxin (flavodoxin) oxidoreductase [Turicibacter sp.]|nr:pyruvate:ferredoxin (flavodoxin) oxidoreductase [Turicibacter sp.]
MEKKIFKSMDGTEAAAYASYAFTEVAGIYPITPSTPMAEFTDLWASQGKKNLFGAPVKVVEMQSEAGAAGVVHGSLQTGALTTTYTASQGLLLKIPNMYKIAGQLLPGVIHVSARALATHALSIFGDHQDIYATRQTGWAMLATSSVQEVMDLGGLAHLAAIRSSVPFLHFYDGFRTSHEIQKVEVMDYKHFDRLLDKEAVETFRARSLSPNNPVTKGSAQNDDVYFQGREAQNKYYDAIPDIVADYMKEISDVTGREYKPFVYYGHPEATEIIIAMGSACETIKGTVDYLNTQGRKVGFINVHLYRPFSSEYFFHVFPESVRKIAVLDRTKESGALCEPLCLDIRGLFQGREDAPVIIGGRYGLSSKDTTPGQIVAVFDNLAGDMKDDFTIGITDDVTFKSLPTVAGVHTLGSDVTEALFFGLGSDGTIGANKNTIKIMGENTDGYGQAYFAYDSKKSGGLTKSHLRFSANPIQAPYLVSTPSFVSCSLDTYIGKYDLISGLREGGTFLLNTVSSAEEIIQKLPNEFKKMLADKKAKFYILDAVSLAREIGLGRRTNTIMQSAFFKLNPQMMPYEQSMKLMKDYVVKLYSRKGEKVVALNHEAIDKGAEGLTEVAVDPAWSDLPIEAPVVDGSRPDFVRNIVDSIVRAEGNELPVSAFSEYVDGTMPQGTTAYEKRGIASFIPRWNEENCIQCNQCAFVCPHAVIRPFLLTEEEKANMPDGTKTLKAMGRGLDGLDYRIQISTLDCTGCELCVSICPGKRGAKALEMVPIGEEIAAGEVQASEYFFNNVTYKDTLLPKTTVKGSQFAQPLFEFSGACAGCGETPYLGLLTRLFGANMTIANATGCSSIYGASYPATPYTTNADGQGPAWANSLFEDNAEFGFGMNIAGETLRDRIQMSLEEILPTLTDGDAEVVNHWITHRFSIAETTSIRSDLERVLAAHDSDAARDALGLADYIVKRSNWMVGGDGWAYDIGFGGLDHVIANNEDVNILVMDTEVYSNTGGQSSKSSAKGSLAKFTAAGKPSTKKKLAELAMSYGHVYVAQVSHGANQAQVIKAMMEAEAHPGPSLIIAYSPCIAHGIKGGLANTMNQAALATASGYWPTFRFLPSELAAGANPLKIDCKEPDWDRYHDFLMSEDRYAQLYKINPEQAESLLAANKSEAMRRYRQLVRLAALDYSDEASVVEVVE